MRRRILVNSRFQLAHMLNIMFIVGAGAFVLSFLIAWIFLGFFDRRLELCGTHEGFFVFLVAACIIIISGAVWSLLYTRSIAGQMHRISVLLDNAANDELPEKNSIKFRDNDRFMEIASSLESCFENIRTKKSALEKSAALKKKLKDFLAAEKYREADEIIGQENNF